MTEFTMLFDVDDSDGLMRVVLEDVVGDHDLPDKIDEIMIGSGTTSLEALYEAVAKAYRAQLEKRYIPETAPGMSLDELTVLKADLYNTAITSHVHEKAKLVQSLYAYSYSQFESRGLTIGNDLGLNIKFKGKTVYSVRQQLFLPGAWIGILDTLYERALVEQKRREIVNTEKKRQQLLAELGLS